MSKNVGPEDRVVRIVIAIALAVLIYVGSVGSTGAIIAGVIAAYLAITGLIGSCPIYRMIDVDTSVQEQAYTKPDDSIDF